ncbi:MAG TPA: PAS domain-containing protein [Pyrinomonadaceae bacterium]|nr:PAS domain-containing protein [Pyrinomonadaceae bacterium]
MGIFSESEDSEANYFLVIGISAPANDIETLKETIASLAPQAQIEFIKNLKLPQKKESIELIRETLERSLAEAERVRSEAILRESEEKLRAFISATSDIVYEMSADWQTMLSLDGKEFIASTETPRVDWTEEYIPADEKARVWAAINKAIEEKSFFELEHRVFRIDGSIGWTFSRAIPLFGLTGKIVRWFGTASDITDRKQFGEALGNSERMFSTLIENAPFGIYVIDSKFTMRMINAGSRAVFSGIEPLIGRDFEEVLRIVWTEPFATKVIDHFRTALETGESYISPTIIELRANIDEIQAYDWQVHRVTLPDGSFGVVCYFYDLSKQKRLEAALLESKERLSIAVEAAELATWDWDLQTNEIIWNERHFLIFGIEPSGQSQNPESFFQFVHPEDRDRLGKRLKKAIETNTTFEAEFRIIRADKKTRWMEGYGHVVETLKGKPIRMSGVMSDITNRKNSEKTEHEKEMLEKMVNALEDERRRIARDLHDELGQLLTALRLKLENVKNLCTDHRELCDQIDETQLLAKKLDDGVDFLAWELRPASLDDLGLYAALDKYVHEWSTFSGIPASLFSTSIKKMRFASEIETNLYRIAQEALNNVHKHAEAKAVEVLLERRENNIVLIISDDGKGFDINNQMPPVKGIGLVGMKERAALVGGSLEIESETGKGTTVYARVPVSIFEEEANG